MNNIKLIVAAATVLAASSAFAQSDGQSDNAWLMNPPTVQSPAKPVPAASADYRSGDRSNANLGTSKGEDAAPRPYQGEHDHAW